MRDFNNQVRLAEIFWLQLLLSPCYESSDRFQSSAIPFSISGVYIGMDWHPVQGGDGTGSSTPAQQATPNLGCMDGWRFHVMTS